MAVERDRLRRESARGAAAARLAVEGGRLRRESAGEPPPSGWPSREAAYAGKASGEAAAVGEAAVAGGGRCRWAVLEGGRRWARWWRARDEASTAGVLLG